MLTSSLAPERGARQRRKCGAAGHDVFVLDLPATGPVKLNVPHALHRASGEVGEDHNTGQDSDIQYSFAWVDVDRKSNTEISVGDMPESECTIISKERAGSSTPSRTWQTRWVGSRWHRRTDEGGVDVRRP